jgi:PAS domain S-box-containing protein
MAGSLTDVTETRRAIEAQQASEARLKEAQHLARIGNWELDLVTDTLTWSDEIFRIFEMDPARFGASSEAFLQAVHPDDREMVSATYRASVVNKTSYGVVHRLQMADGRIKWVEERGQTRYGDDGRPLRSLGVVQDITEREAASQELEVERNFSAAVFDFTPALIIVFDRHGRIVRYNDAAAAVSGYDKTELIGRLAWDVLLALPEERREVAERFAALSTMTCAEARARFGSTSQRTWRARGGAVRRITWSLAYLPDDQGKVAYSVASGLDVTEREQVEQALRASERKYRQLHESMTDAFVRVAMTGEILECNRAYEEMLGYTREELSRLTYVDLTPEQWRDAEMRLVAEEVLTRGYSGVYEKEYARKNREIFPVELRTFLLRDEAGVPSGMWAIVRDITARKRTEAELRRSLAEKEVLLQEVHHRVKNNLAVVAELLNLQALGSTDGALRTALRESQNRIQSMALIHETLYHSRELSAIPLGTYTERLCRQLFESYSVHAGHVRLSVIADPVELDLGRAVPFSLILNELVSNALKHAFPAGRPGSVEVRVTAEPPGALTLTVRDDGVGLDPAITAETASTLGMRLIRALAAQIRAALEIERRDGTIVRVILPGVNPSPPVS